MNRQLYQLCIDYIRCYDLLQALISIDGIDSERLKLFRLTQTRMKEIEREFETAIVENDLLNSMTKEKKGGNDYE